MVLNLTGHVIDIFQGRVHAPPSWILIYSYDYHGHNDTNSTMGRNTLCMV